MNKVCTFNTLVFMLLSGGMLQQALAQQSSPAPTQKSVASLFASNKEDELLEPDQAFKFNATVKGSNILVAQLAPSNGYYLYKDRIRFAIKNANGMTIRTVKLPTGEIKTDQFFGKMETYKKPVQAEITLDRSPNTKNVTLVATYQGCHEKKGVCYAPIEKIVELAFP